MNNETLNQVFTNTANSIRAKLNSEDGIKPENFATNINNIPGPNGIYKVSTIAERDNLNASEGDICLVRGYFWRPVTKINSFNIFKVPKTKVKFANPITTSSSFSFRGNLGVLNIIYSSSSIVIRYDDFNRENNNFSIQYTSEDGSIYSAGIPSGSNYTETTTDYIVDPDETFLYEDYSEYGEIWSDTVVKLIRTEVLEFNGIYQYLPKEDYVETVDVNGNTRYITMSILAKINKFILSTWDAVIPNMRFIAYDCVYDNNNFLVSCAVRRLLNTGNLYINNGYLYHSGDNQGSIGIDNYIDSFGNMKDYEGMTINQSSFETNPITTEESLVNCLLFKPEETWYLDKGPLKSTIYESDKITVRYNYTTYMTLVTATGYEWKPLSFGFNTDYNDLLYNKQAISDYGIVSGSITTNIDKHFNDNNALVYYKAQQYYDSLPVYSASNVDDIKMFLTNYNPYIIPRKSDGTLLLDTSSCTNFEHMFSGNNESKKLLYLPSIDTSNGTSFNAMCQSCVSLVTVDELNLSKATSIFQMFSACNSLVNIPYFSIPNVIDLTWAFESCPNLSDTSLNNILKMCVSATKYSGNKKLSVLLSLRYYPNERIEALPSYQDFLNAGWTIN